MTGWRSGLSVALKRVRLDPTRDDFDQLYQLARYESELLPGHWKAAQPSPSA